MPRQNRVTPLGELIADPARGLVYGNRGCLHDEQGRIRRRYAVKRLDRVPAPVPRLASQPVDAAGPLHGAVLPRRGDSAGRRSPALCTLQAQGLRDLTAFWRELYPGEADADAIDARLNSERLGKHGNAWLDSLPDGAFVLWDKEPRLVLGERLLRWKPSGYEDPLRRLSGVSSAPCHPALPRCLAAHRAGAARPAAPSVGHG
jgi:hypothetical protein